MSQKFVTSINATHRLNIYVLISLVNFYTYAILKYFLNFIYGFVFKDYYDLI